MNLTRYTGNTSVISALADTPTLTAAELKAKFDEADAVEKAYLNNTLLPEIEQGVAAEKVTLQGLITALGDTLRSEIAAAILADNKSKYYVGKIIIDTANVNPATYLGFGTWQYWGSGKVPVGVDAVDEDFNEVEKTGGEKEHTLTTNEMPSHSHSIIFPANPNSGSIYNDGYFTGGGGNAAWGYTFNKVTNSSGGGQPHNNMPPFITCYMWKRVS